MVELSFGAYLKALRVSNELTLREYCRRLDKDAGNVSKLERGILPPPKDESLVKQYGQALGLEDDAPEMKELIRLAAIGSGHLPKDVLEDDELVDKLPVFFRTVTGSRLDRKKIMDFLESLRKA